MKEILLAVAPILTLAVTLLGAFLLHIRESRKTRAEQESRAQSIAQEQIQMALQERGLERRVEGLSSRLDSESRQRQELEKRLTDLQLQIPERFVRREDYIEAQARTERKLDKIWSQVHDIAVKQTPS